MQLTKCPVCQQQVSPMASNCPSCGHPTPAEKPSAWFRLSMQMPSMFYGMVFLGCGLASGLGFLAAGVIFGNAATVMHEIFSALLAILAALFALIAMVAAIAVDRR